MTLRSVVPAAVGTHLLLLVAMVQFVCLTSGNFCIDFFVSSVTEPCTTDKKEEELHNISLKYPWCFFVVFNDMKIE